MMRAILDHCRGIPVETVVDGTVLLDEGRATGRLYVLAEGQLAVTRGATLIVMHAEPGAMVGEMSILLGAPHTATVRALGDARLHVIEDGRAFLTSRPELMWLVARLLASRLNAATSYLADLTQQFAEHGTHLEMVGEVLDTLLHDQAHELRPGSDRDPGIA